MGEVKVFVRMTQLIIMPLLATNLAGCVAGSISDPLSRPANLITQTKSSTLIEDIPRPRRRVPVSVFPVKDETGQLKPNDVFADFSRAVTQAGGPILIDVLKRAGQGEWFKVLERVDLTSVVQERKIIAQKRIHALQQIHLDPNALPQAENVSATNLSGLRTRVQEARREFEKLNAELKKRGEAFKKRQEADANATVSEEDTKLREKVLEARERLQKAQGNLDRATAADKRPPDYEEQRTLVRSKRELELLQTQQAIANLTEHQVPAIQAARYIVSGSIVGFDSNELTSGVGARFLGIGGDKKHRRDTVTVNLRVIDPISSEVVISVTTTKTIYAVGLQGGAYRFAAVDKILEIEAGVTKNELGSLAVRHGIELGVFALIAEGIKEGLWTTADPHEAEKILEIYNRAEDKRETGML